MKCGECVSAVLLSPDFPFVVFCKRFLLTMDADKGSDFCRSFEPKPRHKFDLLRSLAPEELAAWLEQELRDGVPTDWAAWLQEEVAP